jgi:dTDP-4-dehydrorhamnose reductase
MKILITGASGLLGHATAQLARGRGHQVYAAYNEHKVSIGTPIRLDITDKDKLLKAISVGNPDAIIHTAAYTNVDGCETNRDLAWKANAEATRNIAIVAASIPAHLTYVSTDYVFDGEKGLYTEDDEPNPRSYYGHTKLKGEEFVKAHARVWCIARPSVIYGWGPAHKQNFATWLITNLKQKQQVKILIDQYVSPTLNANLAQMLLEITEERMTGILHTAGATRVNRHEFALELASAFGLNKNSLKPATMKEMTWQAKRPKDSSLDVSKAAALLDHKPLGLAKALEMMRKHSL